MLKGAPFGGPGEATGRVLRTSAKYSQDQSQLPSLELPVTSEQKPIYGCIYIYNIYMLHKDTYVYVYIYIYICIH